MIKLLIVFIDVDDRRPSVIDDDVAKFVLGVELILAQVTTVRGFGWLVEARGFGAGAAVVVR